MRTTLKHVQGLCSRNPLILRKSGGAFGDLPIVKAIIGCVKLDVLQWMYERTNGNDGYLFDWKNGKGQTLLHICAQGNRKFQDSSHLLPFLLFSQPHSASVRDEFGKTPLDYAKEDENDISIDLLLFPDETIRNYVEKRKMQFKQREIRELMVSSLYEYVTFEKRRCQNRWLNTTLDVVKQYCNEFPGILITRGGKDNQYPIFYAVSAGASMKIVMYIGERTGSDKVKNIKGWCGRTLLHIAVFNNHYHLLPYLLSLYPEAVNVKDSWGRTPIDWAKLKRSEKPVKILLEHKRRREKMIKTATESSSKWQNTSIKHIKGFMLKDPNILWRRGGSYKEFPIYYAIMYKAKTVVVEYICEHTGINRVCDWRDEKDQTIVHIAASLTYKQGEECSLPYLMSIFPEACYLENLKDEIPLHIARMKNSKEAINFLLHPENTVKTYEMAKFKRTEQQFLDHGGRIVERVWGNTIETRVMHDRDLIAGASSHVDAQYKTNEAEIIVKNVAWYDTTIEHVKELESHDPDFLKGTTMYGNRTLFNAVRFGVRQETLQWMVESIGVETVQIWRSSNNGWTLLHIAAHENHVFLIPYLLSIHPEASKVKDNLGRTPITCAMRKGNDECVRLLRDPETTVETYRQTLFVYRDLKATSKRPASV